MDMGGKNKSYDLFQNTIDVKENIILWKSELVHMSSKDFGFNKETCNASSQLPDV